MSDYIIRELQKRYCQGVVNIFETGSYTGNYAQVTVLKGDSGNLTYGKSQATLSSGNLEILLKDYKNNGGEYSCELKQFMDRVKNRDTSLNNDNDFHRILKKAGKNDPIMKQTQDNFFDRLYWRPAAETAIRFNCYMPFSTMVIYDSRIHGSWNYMARRTTDKVGKSEEIGEVPWIKEYIKTRRDWLANHQNKLLNNTVYRMDTFLDLIDDKNWIMTPPFIVRDRKVEMEGILDRYEKDKNTFEYTKEIDEENIKGEGIKAEEEFDKTLSLTDPYMKGDTVKTVQKILGKKVDGIYGPKTKEAVKKFQEEHDLIIDGKVGPNTWKKMWKTYQEE